jgi:hypothetical protein
VRPKIADNVAQMDARLFQPEPIGLEARLAAQAPVLRNPRLAALA